MTAAAAVVEALRMGMVEKAKMYAVVGVGVSVMVGVCWRWWECVGDGDGLLAVVRC